MRLSYAAMARIPIALGACLLLAGCSQDLSPTPDPSAALPTRPDTRFTGPRMPSFSGTDPAQRGWVKVDGLLWVAADQADAYARGLVFDGTSYAPVDRGLPPGTPPETGFLLRTDHVSLRTNLPWREGVRVARIAETHVVNLVAAYGEALDLRLPAAPLTVVASARRAEFETRLRQVVADPVGWGAFYDSRSGAVHVSAEPALRGPLPLEADLRHEMTHQVLDLSTPQVGRGRIFGGLYFWLWEGIAVDAENLGDPPGRGAGAERLARFRRRLAWNDTTPLERLFALSQSDFEGKHYDQTASLMAFLASDAVPGARAALLATLHRLLRGQAQPGEWERAVGLGPRDLEARWLAATAR
jgi:hypothetical protein